MRTNQLENLNFFQFRTMFFYLISLPKTKYPYPKKGAQPHLDLDW